jgi:aspartate 1-decarboxylase
LTATNLHYVGSLSLDQAILERLDFLPNEVVDVLNLNNGARLTTYIIPAEKGSGAVALNGAAARLGMPGDKVLIVAYATMSDEEARRFHPKVAFVDDGNRIVEIIEDSASLTGKRLG